MKIFKNVFIAIVFIVLILAILSVYIPSKYKVERSLQINAPIEQVYHEIANLQNWQHWSPWQKMDPDMIVAYYGPEIGVGAMQEWKSDEIGSGKLSIVAIDTNRSIIYSLSFDGFEPMQGRFELTEEPGVVTVYWLAEGDVGKNPVKKYFALMMDAVMGKDFEKGLENLKVWCEFN